MATLKAAARALRRGQIVAFPTESFWALGVIATNSRAVDLLFREKYRMKNRPIALIAADFRQVETFFFLKPSERRLALKYWPGSVTILLKPKNAIAARSLGARRIGVRVPAHAGARALARAVGAPITATSANESGQPPTKSKRVVARGFPGILSLAGTCGRQRKPSTIVQYKRNNLITIRPGVVTLFG